MDFENDLNREIIDLRQCRSLGELISVQHAAAS